MDEKSLYLLAQFDKETQKILTEYYDILQANGFVGKQTKNIPYHFTLGNMEIDYVKHPVDDYEKICGNTSGIDILLSHIGLFGLDVLFIAPDANYKLLELQQKFFPNCGNEVHSWTPHATLLMDEPENTIKALPLIAKHFKPFNARIESIGLYEFFPIRFIKELSLSNKA